MAGWSVELLEEKDNWRWYQVLPPASVLQVQQIDLMAHLDEAQVFFSGPDGEMIDCSRWHFGRWTCGPEDWLWVGQYEMEIQGVQRSCIWAHPRTNHELNIQFEDLPYLNRINGRYGIADAAVDMEGGAPVHLSVEMGERTRRLTAENQRGFFSYHLSREHTEGELPTGVRFTISSEDDGMRHFCFTARVFLERDEPEEVEQSDVDSVGMERGPTPFHHLDRIRNQGALRQRYHEREDESHLPAGSGD
jgi:hypothetical protein